MTKSLDIEPAEPPGRNDLHAQYKPIGVKAVASACAPGKTTRNASSDDASTNQKRKFDERFRHDV